MAALDRCLGHLTSLRGVPVRRCTRKRAAEGPYCAVCGKNPLRQAMLSAILRPDWATQIQRLQGSARAKHTSAIAPTPRAPRTGLWPQAPKPQVAESRPDPQDAPREQRSPLDALKWWETP